MTKTATTLKAAAKPRGAQASRVLPQLEEQPKPEEPPKPAGHSDDNGFEEGKAAKSMAILVTARGDRFRRAGHTFTAEPTRLLLADLDEDVQAALLNEPALHVVLEDDAS